MILINRCWSDLDCTCFLVSLFICLLSTLVTCLLLRKLKKQALELTNLQNYLKIKTQHLRSAEQENKEYLQRFEAAALLMDLGKLAAGLVHDIKEPLSVLSIILQNARSHHQQIDDFDQAVIAIDKISALLNVCLKDLLGQSEFEVFILNYEINKVINLLTYKARDKQVRIIFKPSQTFELHADRAKLNQVLFNLLLNAIESYDNLDITEKNVFIKLVRKPRNLLIKIKDYGSGINQKNLSKIFELGFSSKVFGESLGVGLYVSQEVMTKTYGSKIKVESKNNVGSVFTLFIKNKFVLDKYYRVNARH